MENIIYKVAVPNMRSKFKDWIENRGGVTVWHNVNMSTNAGDTFTPALTEDGKPYPKPSVSVSQGKTVKDLQQFKFLKEMKEEKRIRVFTRMGSQGFITKLTDDSSVRLKNALAVVGEDAYYHFEEKEGPKGIIKEAVIEKAIWE